MLSDLMQYRKEGYHKIERLESLLRTNMEYGKDWRYIEWPTDGFNNDDILGGRQPQTPYQPRRHVDPFEEVTRVTKDEGVSHWLHFLGPPEEWFEII